MARQRKQSRAAGIRKSHGKRRRYKKVAKRVNKRTNKKIKKTGEDKKEAKPQESSSDTQMAEGLPKITLGSKLSIIPVSVTNPPSPKQEGESQSKVIHNKRSAKRKISHETKKTERKSQKNKKRKKGSPIPWSESCRGTCVETADGYLYEQEDYDADQGKKIEAEIETPKTEKQTSSLLKFFIFDMMKKKSEENQNEKEAVENTEKEDKNSGKKKEKIKKPTSKEKSSPASKKKSKEN